MRWKALRSSVSPENSSTPRVPNFASWSPANTAPVHFPRDVCHIYLARIPLRYRRLTRHKSVPNFQSWTAAYATSIKFYLTLKLYLNLSKCLNRFRLLVLKILIRNFNLRFWFCFELPMARLALDVFLVPASINFHNSSFLPLELFQKNTFQRPHRRFVRA